MKTKQSLQKLLDATKRTQYVDKEFLKTAPKPQKGTIEFFKLDKYISDDGLEKEYASRGLIACDPYTLTQRDLDFRDDMDEKRYVATHWKNENGKWQYIAFRQWRDVGRLVDVRRGDGDWSDFWWFAGLRKSSKLKPSELSDTSALSPSAEYNRGYEDGKKAERERILNELNKMS